MKKNRVVPKLRFKGFNEEWKIMKLGELFKISAGGDISKEYVSNRKTEDFKYPIFANAVKNKGLYGYSNKYKVEGNVITVAGRGNLGVAHSRKEKFYPIVRLLVLRPKDDCNVDYFENRINLMKIFNESTGVPQLTAPQLSTYNISYPSILEQNKLAEFLSSIDKKIKLLDKKKEKLQRYKKGVMQKIFSQEIRFKDDNGNEYPDWEEKKLNEVMSERNIKAPKSSSYPLMSFVAYEGVKPKGNRYNREFLVNDTDNKKYKQTEYADFIYSSNNLESGSIGLNRYGAASISPVYSIFKIKELYNYEFINNYLSRKSFINKMIRFRQGVVYGQWKIHESNFLKIQDKFPSLKEQKKIASFLSIIDKKIESVNSQLEKTKEFKKGLLQQMFV